MQYCICSLLAGLLPWLAAPGDWPEPRQNPQLTAVQPMSGRMAGAPECIAQYDLGRSQPTITPVIAADGQTQYGVCIVAGALYCFDQKGTLRWRQHPAGINFSTISAQGDLNGDGKVEILLQAGRPTEPYAAAVLMSLEEGTVIWRYDVDPMSYAWYLYAGDYLPDARAQEIVVIMHGYPPDKENGYIAFFSFKDGIPRQQWRYNFDLYTCFPAFYQTDLEGDGKKELVVETHSRMWFFDAATGEKKHFVQWDVSPANVRSYGFTQFVDLNHDGREDFLCIANFAQHQEVLLNKGGVFELAWTHGWPESVTTGKVATVWADSPYVDVDGDAHYEIVVSMFNSENESNWLVRAYDAITGALKYRMPGMIAVAVADVNNDGKAELLVNASKDPTRTVLDGVHLLQVNEGKFEVLWSEKNAEALALQKGSALLVKRGGEKYALSADSNSAVTLSPWHEPEHEVKPDFSSVPAIQGPAFPDLLVSDLNADGQNELILYREPDITVLRLNDGKLDVLDKFTSSALPVLADLNGDGKTDLVTCTVQPEGPPTVEAFTPVLNNQSLWRVTLPPPDRGGLPQPRKAYMRTAHFLGNSEPDIYLWVGTPVVRNIALNGKTGEVIWERGEVPNSERYWGPSVNLASVWDYNADGKEDLVFTNPDYYCVASGVDGSFLAGPLFPPKIFNQPSQGLYTFPAVLVENSGDPTVCLVGGHYFQGVMSLRANLYWYCVPAVGENRCAQEGFLCTKEGVWLMGFGRQNGRFACLQVREGTMRWELPLDATASDIVACDIDGDGNVEFIVGTSHGDLCAVRDEGSQPKELWKIKSEGALGTPIPADINTDGFSELIVPSSDGYLRIFGTNPH
ncbi:MAG TPA: VCBS repeat-containing protein [Candidatus Hydrogenedentes bacterium]|nr:VCBS repeat-containing protein [Candidatus Hydrogenedentota bacterium]